MELLNVHQGRTIVSLQASDCLLLVDACDAALDSEKCAVHEESAREMTTVRSFFLILSQVESWIKNAVSA